MVIQVKPLLSSNYCTVAFHTLGKRERPVWDPCKTAPAFTSHLIIDVSPIFIEHLVCQSVTHTNFAN